MYHPPQAFLGQFDFSAWDTVQDEQTRTFGIALMIIYCALATLLLANLLIGEHVRDDHIQRVNPGRTVLDPSLTLVSWARATDLLATNLIAACRFSKRCAGTDAGSPD